MTNGDDMDIFYTLCNNRAIWQSYLEGNNMLHTGYALYMGRIVRVTYWLNYDGQEIFNNFPYPGTLGLASWLGDRGHWSL